VCVCVCDLHCVVNDAGTSWSVLPLHDTENNSKHDS